ncbi:hypothetical protein ACGRHY_28045 [Streptomyces sp. HK10]|uniref:hypothetical protein n=1 Tax=Streptomyces sp. HK10 TaxID=3373255 RepID=UPI003748B55A
MSGLDEQLAAVVDRIARTSDSAALADLVCRAADLFAALEGHGTVGEVPEAFAATMAAVAATSHLPTLADLARRARQLWKDPATVAGDSACAFVGCLPEYAHHPAVVAASAAARRAGIPLAVFRHDWRDAYGQHGAQGLYLSPSGERGVEAFWCIDGRDNERALGRSRITRDRATRNTALMTVHDTLVASGWSVYVKQSTNTATRRILSIPATLPR